MTSLWGLAWRTSNLQNSSALLKDAWTTRKGGTSKNAKIAGELSSKHISTRTAASGAPTVECGWCDDSCRATGCVSLVPLRRSTRAAASSALLPSPATCTATLCNLRTALWTLSSDSNSGRRSFQSALSSGDLTGAQSAFDKLMQDLQQMKGRHHHHRYHHSQNPQNVAENGGADNANR